MVACFSCLASYMDGASYKTCSKLESTKHAAFIHIVFQSGCTVSFSVSNSSLEEIDFLLMRNWEVTVVTTHIFIQNIYIWPL